MTNASLAMDETERGSAPNDGSTTRDGWERTRNEAHEYVYDTEPLRFHRQDFQIDLEEERMY